jgi:hypothetical protein
MTDNKWASSDLKWDEESKKYPFNLPTIEGKLYLENDMIEYDPVYLETFEISFDNYLANHPTGNSFPFTKEIVMKNMKGTLETLRNQARLDKLYMQKHQKEYMMKGHFGRPERGYTWKMFLYPDWIIL